MITLKEFLEVVDYQITEGWQHQWQCFGGNAYALDHHDPDRSKNSFTIIFDKKNKIVYCAEAHDYENDRSYRLLNPEFAQAYRDECKQKGVPDMAWDNVAYIDLETAEDWLEKAEAIFAGEAYDTRVQMPVDFTDEELLKYMKLAHERDITFNQLVEEALREAIDAAKRDPNAFKARAQAFANN